MNATSPSLWSEPLTRDECQRRLEVADVARVLISLRGLPAALSARIEHVAPDHIVFSSRENAVLLAARRGDVVSVQIDGLDNDANTWSVNVTGIVGTIPPDEVTTERFKRIVNGGATLAVLPLSIVSGQREH
jgi:hypothetical protein